MKVHNELDMPIKYNDEKASNYQIWLIPENIFFSIDKAKKGCKKRKNFVNKYLLNDVNLLFILP